MSGRVD